MRLDDWGSGSYRHGGMISFVIPGISYSMHVLLFQLKHGKYI